jgi:TatD DNase family protein
MIVPGIDTETSGQAVETARHPGVRAAVGIHPAEAVDAPGLEGIVRLAFEPGVVAIGESGLDGSPGSPTAALQEDLLLQHAGLARDLELPLVVHSRAAEEAIVRILGDPGTPVVMHCYTGPHGPALEAAGRGWHVSFAGALTFRRRSDLRELVSRLPRESLLVETDSPYMAPEPWRGGPSEPAHAARTAEVMAGCCGLTPGGMAEILARNVRRAFLDPLERAAAVYVLGPRAYVNLTGSCPNDCTFCVRRRTSGLGGYTLRHHDGDPSRGRVLGCIRRLPRAGLEELVFCGFGEPTTRPDLLGEAAALASSAGWRTRLDTNGLGLLWMDEERAAGLIGLFDGVSISLNAHDEASYDALCRPSLAGSWDALARFSRLAVSLCRDVRFTAVAAEGVDLDAVSRLARELGGRFTARRLCC